MSLPRQVLPGQFYLVSRRCTQRSLLARPSEETNQIFEYAFAEAAQRFEIDLIGTAVMSNHYHGVVFDRHGNIVAFIEHAHKYIARPMNELLGRNENFWSSEQTSLVRLVDAADVIAKLIYVLMNPVKAHLVERAFHWPGVNSYSDLVNDRERVIERPRRFFAPAGKMPAKVSLRYVIPAELGLGKPGEVREALREAVKAEEMRLIAERQATGTRVLGRRAVLKQDPNGRPESIEAKGKINPRVAAKSRGARIEALVGLRAFRDAYRRARESYLFDKNTVFPYGTYWMRRFVGVQVAGPPLAAA